MWQYDGSVDGYPYKDIEEEGEQGGCVGDEEGEEEGVEDEEERGEDEEGRGDEGDKGNDNAEGDESGGMFHGSLSVTAVNPWLYTEDETDLYYDTSED